MMDLNRIKENFYNNGIEKQAKETLEKVISVLELEDYRDYIDYAIIDFYSEKEIIVSINKYKVNGEDKDKNLSVDGNRITLASRVISWNKKLKEIILFVEK